MRPFLIGLALFVVPGFIFAACGKDPGSAATGSGTTSSMGGAPSCDGVYIVYGDEDGSDPCDICLHEKCCAEIANCRDETCKKCTNFPDPGCSEISRLARKCADDRCLSTCAPGWPPSTGTSGAGGATSSSSASSG